MESNRVTIGALALLSVVLMCTTFLVYTDDITGELFMAAVASPIVGGLIGFAAGAKGVQQGVQASNAPPSPDA